MDKLSTIAIKPSRIARYVHLAVLLLAIAALWWCGLSLWIKSLLTALLLCVGAWQYQQLKQPTVSAFGLEQEQWWALIQNQKINIELVNEQLVLSWLMVLTFHVNQSGKKEFEKKYSLVLWPDSAHHEDLRRLRVVLRNG